MTPEQAAETERDIIPPTACSCHAPTFPVMDSPPPGVPLPPLPDVCAACGGRIPETGGVILDWSAEIADRRAWPPPPVADIPARPRVWVYGARESPTPT